MTDTYELPERLDRLIIHTGALPSSFTDDQRDFLIQFAKAVREDCARTAERVAWSWDEQRPFANVAKACAAAIRNG